MFMVSYPVIMRITTRQTVDPPKTLAAQPHQSEGECAKYKGFYPRKVNNETNLGTAHGIMTDPQHNFNSISLK